MIKQSKITVKHFLNTRLKPDIEKNTKIYPLYLSITYDRMNIRTPSHIHNGILNTIKENDFLKNKIDKSILFKMNYETELIERCVFVFKNDENLKQLRKDFHLLYSLKKYRSKIERLNIFNSYIDYYTHSIYDVVSSFLHDEIQKEIIEKLNIEIKDFDLLDDNKVKLLLFPNNPNLYKLITKYKLGFKYETYFILWSRLQSFLAYQGSIYGYDMPYIDWKQGIGQPIFKEYLKTYNRSTDCWNINFFNDKNIDNCIEIIENIINNENYFNKLLKS